LAGWDFFMLFPLHKTAYFLHEKMFENFGEFIWKIEGK
jgi:hypothetical protein